MSPTEPRVVIVGNYAPDGQQSMLRYAASLGEALHSAGVAVKLVQPQRRFGRTRNPHHGMAKWMAYLDKFVLFRRQLRQLAATEPSGTVFHIADHSNSPLSGALRGRPVVVTCHDMLAILGAIGEDPWCPASRSGRMLQKWVLDGLRRVDGVACDSTHTRLDLERLSGRRGDPLIRTVFLSLNDAIGPELQRPARELVDEAVPGLAGRPFLLHVGSSLPRKNRTALVEVLAAAGRAGWTGDVVFAGDPIDPNLRRRAQELGATPRMHGVGAASALVLRALYTSAHALVFPSHGEGFGYPVLEAQACGCPVICTNRTSVPEVAGGAARLHDPEDIEGMARSVIDLGDSGVRATIVSLGRENLRRFTAQGMAAACIKLYADVLAARRGSLHPATP